MLVPKQLHLGVILAFFHLTIRFPSKCIFPHNFLRKLAKCVHNLCPKTHYQHKWVNLDSKKQGCFSKYSWFCSSCSFKGPWMCIWHFLVDHIKCQSWPVASQKIWPLWFKARSDKSCKQGSPIQYHSTKDFLNSWIRQSMALLFPEKCYCVILLHEGDSWMSYLRNSEL